MTGTNLETVFSTTPKLYASSRWKSLAPMNVKMGMMLCSTAWGMSRASSDATNSALCDVRGFVEANDANQLSSSTFAMY
jgi:hypothetical protein